MEGGKENRKERENKLVIKPVSLFAFCTSTKNTLK